MGTTYIPIVEAPFWLIIDFQNSSSVKVSKNDSLKHPARKTSTTVTHLQAPSSSATLQKGDFSSLCGGRRPRSLRPAAIRGVGRLTNGLRIASHNAVYHIELQSPAGDVGDAKAFWVSSLSSAAEQRRLFAMHFVLIERLKEQLVVEEEDGDGQEEEVEAKGEVESRRCAHDYDRR